LGNISKRQWNEGNSGVLYFLTVFLSMVIASVFSLIIGKLINDKYLVDSISTGFLYLIMTIILLYYTRKNDYNLIETSNLKTKINILNYPLLLLIAGASIYFFLPLNTLFIMVLEATGYNISVSVTVDSIQKVILSTIFLCIIPASVEELIYRNSIFNGLKNNHSNMYSVLMCSIMFALFHMNGAQFIYQILMGMILCSVNIIYRTLKAPVILHFLNNFIVIITVYLTGETENTSLLDFKFVFYAICMAISGIIIIVLLLILAFYIKEINEKDNQKGNLTVKSLFKDFKKQFFNKESNKEIIKNKESNTLFIISFSLILILWIINFVLGYVKL
jgi:membrane protease YdiL (CAAX protease family)